MQKIYILILGLFLLTTDISAQVVIKQKVNINPKPQIQLQQSLGDSLFIKNPVYLNYGGEVVLYLENSYPSGFELWEESLGHLEGGTLPYYDSLNLGTYNQWHRFIFYLYDSSTGTKYYNELTAALYLGYPDASSDLTEVSFYPSHQPGDPYPFSPEFSWIMSLDVDTSLVTMPTQEVLNLPGNSNPFLPNGDINNPVSGDVYAVVNYTSTSANIDLYTEFPDDVLLKSGLSSYSGDTLWIGHKNLGDVVRFYIKSTHSLVNGLKLYSDGLYGGVYQEPDGEIFIGTLDFEDWTDLYFENAELEIYMHPDTLTSFPTPVIVEVSPDEIAPGDTAQISLMARNNDGTITPFDLTQVFDAQIVKGGEFGTLYTPTYNFSSDELYGIPQGFSFIAADSIETDSAKVEFLITAYTGVIIGSALKNSENNLNFTRLPGDRDVSKRLFKRSEKKILRMKGNSTKNSYGLIENAADLAYGPPIGFGEVLVRKEGSYPILLGETKYFQAKEVAGRLKIEEVKPGADGVPHLDGGIASDSVWGNEPVSVEKGQKTSENLGIFYDKFYAIIDTIGKAKPVMKDLEHGLIRVIGRFWNRDSTHKALLIAQNGTDSTSISLEVIKPAKLGNNNSTVVGPNNNNWDLDSLIIEVAGRTGVMPQFIKAIIKKESIGFHPSYRYEPFQDLYEGHVRAAFDSTHKYWIKSETDLGNPVIPQHHNLYTASGIIDNYPGFTTAWDYYEANSLLYPHSSLYETENKTYKRFYNNKIDSIKAADKIDFFRAASLAKSLADSRYELYLKQEIGGVGMDFTIAQTRISASYGLMQLTYYSGAKIFSRKLSIYNYPNNNSDFLPEYINLPNVNVKYGTFHFLGWLRIVLGNINYVTEKTWPKNYGLELSYWNALSSYNGRSEKSKEYANEVFNYSNDYLPTINN